VITVTGDERAQAVILRAGRRAQDQSGSLAQAGRASNVASHGAWQDRSGELAASVAQEGVQASADELKITSDVPYARFVFYGTRRQAPKPPAVDERALVDQVQRRVARDLVGQ
jgi:hypothetical protein